MALTLRTLHDLGQNAAHVPGVEEEDRSPMRADARLAENLGALAFEPRLGLVDVGHLVADVMLPARRVLGKEAVDRRVRPKRLDQLDLAVGRIDEADFHALRGQVERLADHLRPHHVAIEGDRGDDRGGGDPDMVEAAELHIESRSPRLKSKSAATRPTAIRLSMCRAISTPNRDPLSARLR